MSVINFPEQGEYITVNDVDGDIHVIPVSVFNRIVSRDMSIMDLEGYEDIVPAIIEDWLYWLEIEPYI